MRRLILVYNRRSSSFWRVEKEALAPARELKAWAIGKFEIAKTNVDDNAKRLARVLTRQEQAPLVQVFTETQIGV